jgi:hypothetical protein
MPAATSSATQPAASIAMTGQRDAGLDDPRAAIVLLVVFHHTAITYGEDGLWYYREVMPDGSLMTCLKSGAPSASRDARLTAFGLAIPSQSSARPAMGRDSEAKAKDHQ